MNGDDRPLSKLRAAEQQVRAEKRETERILARAQRPRYVTLKVIATVGFSLLSYWGWSAFFTATQGECLGPICVEPNTFYMEVPVE